MVKPGKDWEKFPRDVCYTVSDDASSLSHNNRNQTRVTLRLSLIATIGLVMALTLLVGSLAMYARATSKIETEMNAAIRVAQRNAENAITNYTSRINALRLLPRLVSIFDGHRHVQASFVGNVASASSQSQIYRSKSHAPTWFVNLFADAVRQVSIPLPDTIGDIGKFTLTTDPRNEVEEVWDYLTESLMVLAALCLIVPLIIYWQLSHSLRPLEDLSRAFGEVGPERRPAPVPEHGPQELLQVYKGFNQMVDGLSSAEAKNRRLNEQLTAVQEEERADLARDLHDEIGPFLFAVDVDASSLAKLPAATENTDIAGRIDSIRGSVKHMQGIVKSLLGRLRPGVLLDMGLEPAVENLIDFWRGRHPDITITANLPDDDLGEPFTATIYRVIQESLSNAVRHGKPSNIEVNVAADHVRNTIKVSIIDDGGGFEDIETSGPPGFGIRGMRERVQRMGGSMAVTNRRDTSGVLVAAVLPAGGGDTPVPEAEYIETPENKKYAGAKLP